MSKIEVGDVFSTNEGGSVIVVEYPNSKNIRVRHLDVYGYETITTGTELRVGQLKNPYKRSVNGVGYFGVGDYKSRFDGKKTTAYIIWKSMFRRCYDESFHERQPTYKDCEVAEVWHNFQNFAEWFEDQPYQEGWQLDKDLFFKGCKVYSPETCSFVPSKINSLLSNRGRYRGDLPLGVKQNCKGFSTRFNVDGVNKHLGTYETPEQAFSVYKQAKEEHIKEKAEEYKEFLHPKVYEYLMEYEVEP